jgi:hypothetical protein
MSSVRKLRAVLKYGSKNNYTRILVLANVVFAKMTGNAALFSTATALLATLSTQTTAFGGAQKDVVGKVPKAAGVRDAARDAVLTTLKALLSLVQCLADAATPEQSKVIIDAAGMTVAGVPTHSKPILAANLAVAAGTVTLAANAGLLSKSKRKRTYGWQYTIDGKTWLNAASTGVAHTTISGLPSLTVCGFRVNVTDTLTTTEWSQAVTILVH